MELETQEVQAEEVVETPTVEETPEVTIETTEGTESDETLA